jgi:outer membrane protein assembly factor BamE (lipoprotein component of BamABCDE complex)
MAHYNNRLKMCRLFLAGLVSLSILASSGCYIYTDKKGVANKWRDDTLPAFEKSRTTQAEVVELLGPPSQVIGLRDQTVFYYMFENTKGKGVVFLLYNWGARTTIYDRAIFFFDRNGILTEYAYSLERIPYEEDL